jgi:hypothetical protein
MASEPTVDDAIGIITDLIRTRQTDQVAAIKLALMRAVWDPDWGDAAAFTAWIDSGAAEPTPGTIQNGVMFFRAGIIGDAP